MLFIKSLLIRSRKFFKCNRCWCIPLCPSPLSRVVCSRTILQLQFETSLDMHLHRIKLLSPKEDTVHDSEISPVLVLQHTGKETFMGRPHKHTISLSLCWFALLTTSLKMFLTCRVRRIPGYQFLARHSSSHWPSAVSEISCFNNLLIKLIPMY